MTMLKNSFFAFVACLFMVSPLKAQDFLEPQLSGYVTIFDEDFGGGHTVSETLVVLFSEEELPYAFFGGVAPGNFMKIVEGDLVAKKSTGYAHILPPEGYYNIKNIKPGGYWLCNFFLQEEEKMTVTGQFVPFSDSMFMWGCQFVTIKPGQNRQDFYWNSKGFWVQE